MPPRSHKNNISTSLPVDGRTKVLLAKWTTTVDSSSKHFHRKILSLPESQRSGKTFRHVPAIPVTGTGGGGVAHQAAVCRPAPLSQERDGARVHHVLSATRACVGKRVCVCACACIDVMAQADPSPNGRRHLLPRSAGYAPRALNPRRALIQLVQPPLLPRAPCATLRLCSILCGTVPRVASSNAHGCQY